MLRFILLTLLTVTLLPTSYSYAQSDEDTAQIIREINEQLRKEDEEAGPPKLGEFDIEMFKLMTEMKKAEEKQNASIKKWCRENAESEGYTGKELASQTENCFIDEKLMIMEDELYLYGY